VAERNTPAQTSSYSGFNATKYNYIYAQNTHKIDNTYRKSTSKSRKKSRKVDLVD